MISHLFGMVFQIHYGYITCGNCNDYKGSPKNKWGAYFNFKVYINAWNMELR